MPRAVNNSASRKRRKKILKMAKGFYSGRKRQYRAAHAAVWKSLAYSYRDRRTRKRDFRALWIQRIGAAARLNGLNYNQLIHGLSKAQIEIDRKMLADLAVHDEEGFSQVAEAAKTALAA